MRSIADRGGVSVAGAAVEVDGVYYAYGDFVALHGVSLTVEAGEFVTLLGPSGSGKTTLLRILAGLLQPDRGRIHIAGRHVTNLPPEQRNVGMVFQNYALFPHMNVSENVSFALKVRRVPRQQVREQVEQVLTLVGLEQFRLRYPSQLSGGQQQRVALARAIVFKPRVLLMDEPLGSLDKRLRQQLQVELRRLQREVGITTIYVTHDQDEAFAMSDRIAVMNRGQVLQFGTPIEVYRSPADRFVAEFVGELNYFRGRLMSNGNDTIVKTARGLEIRVVARREDKLGVAVSCGLRPERICIGQQLSTLNRFAARVKSVQFKGSRQWAEVILPHGEEVRVEVAQDRGLKQGDETLIGWDLPDMLVFLEG